MTPRRSSSDVAPALVDAAARLLAEEGHRAVSARRLATEVGTSTMAVYTHFGSMEEVLTHVRREGFVRFGRALESTTSTDDPVADWMVLGWAYRRFALDEPHLYRAMFGEAGSFLPVSHEDAVAALATFQSLIDRIERCATSGRWRVSELTTAGEVIWAGSHGLASMEIAGYFAGTGRDPITAHEESMRRTAHGYGDDPDAITASASRARRRGHPRTP